MHVQTHGIITGFLVLAKVDDCSLRITVVRSAVSLSVCCPQVPR